MPHRTIETETLRTIVSTRLRAALEKRARQQRRNLSEHVRALLAADCGDEQLAQVPRRGRPSRKGSI